MNRVSNTSKNTQALTDFGKATRMPMIGIKLTIREYVHLMNRQPTYNQRICSIRRPMGRGENVTWEHPLTRPGQWWIMMPYVENSQD